jgi:small-conductance mechanosensitive channel
MLAVLQSWERFFLFIAAVLLIGLVGHHLVYGILRRLVKRTESAVDDSFVRRCYRPLNWIAVLLVIRLGSRLPSFQGDVPELINHGLGLLLIGLFAWLLIKAIYVLEDYVLNRFDVSAKDNLKARKIQTQFAVLKRLVIAVVSILAFGTMLMTFEKVRQLGATILASAGVIGIVVGMAAQKTIGNFIAGIQIAVTQPIRVDDMVVVENETGRIEEITLTYVVVRLWDLRRLIVPITYFIETPFQNWTRARSDLLGTVFVYVDYTVPVEDIRQDLNRVVSDSPLWDGKSCVLDVTNLTDRTVELRAVVSAANAESLWNLRCEVREKLIEFIRSNYPEALPKLRTQVEGMGNRD